MTDNKRLKNIKISDNKKPAVFGGFCNFNYLIYYAWVPWNPSPLE